LQPYVNGVKDFLAVSALLLRVSTYLKELAKETRQKVLRRVLILIDEVLGLEEGHLWQLHQDDQGRTGDDVCSALCVIIKSCF
jgi:hypothetical protein